MKSETIGWATFHNDPSAIFSKAFKTEMSDQLLSQFNAMMEIENFAENNDLRLNIGRIEMKTAFQNEYAFGLVEIISPTGTGTLTVYWKAPDNIIVQTAKSLKSFDVEFGWCADFDKNYFLNIPKQKLVEDLQIKALGFRYTAGFGSYPNLLFVFKFAQEPSQSQSESLLTLIANHLKSCSITENKGLNDECRIKLRFPGKSLDKDLLMINEFIRSLSISELRQAICLVSIE